MNEAEVLYNSILFDHDYYLNSINMENENREFAVNHYLTSGWKNGFSTSILFSSREYFLLNPDVKNKNVCPLLHWEICGKSEGRRYRIEPMSKRLSDICGLNIKNVEFGGGGKILLESPIRITNLTWLVRNNQSIGAFSYFESKSLIYGIDSVGRYCSVAADVTLGGGNHGIKTLSTSPAFYNSIPLFNKYELLSDEDYACNEEAIRKSNNKKIEVSIGNDVWIGNGAKVLGGVTIGDGAVIGAGSVVTKDVPPYAVVAGVPAKILKYRFSDEIIDKLLKIKWWRFGPEITCGLPFGKIEQMIGELESRIAHWQEYYSPMFLYDLNAHTIVRSN